MLYLVLSLLLLGLIAMIVGVIRNHRLERLMKEGKINQLPSIKQVNDMECCGQHEVCEKDSLLAAVSKEIEYFDDEELDRFCGADENDYTDEDEEEFRNVLYTMKEEEVPAWIRSLQLRGVALPVGLRDEVVMIVDDVRTKASQH